MAVQIDTMELQVDSAAPSQAAADVHPSTPLPSPQQQLRDAWLAARHRELLARWAAFDRDDER